MRRHSRLESLVPLTPTTTLVRLRKDPEFSFEAGQHLLLDVGVQGVAPGYFSIASPPESAVLELLVRRSTDAPDSRLAADVLSRMQPGERIWIEGPFGGFGYRPSAERRACFVAQGTGVAPLFSILRSRRFQEAPPLHTLFLAGFKDESEVIGLEPLAVPLGTESYLISLSRPGDPAWAGPSGRVTDLLERGELGIEWSRTDFYLCGGFEMVSEIKAILARRGVGAGAVFSD